MINAVKILHNFGDLPTEEESRIFYPENQKKNIQF